LWWEKLEQLLLLMMTEAPKKGRKKYRGAEEGGGAGKIARKIKENFHTGAKKIHMGQYELCGWPW
jgi:hypothetical protein